MSFIGFIEQLFNLSEVTDNKLSFLSNNICQDPLENFFGCQHQRGGTNDNPTAYDFANNTQSLRVINSFCRGPVRGNCRGDGAKNASHDQMPLFKRRQTSSK